MGTRGREEGRERGQGVRAMGLVWERLARLLGPTATHHHLPHKPALHTCHKNRQGPPGGGTEGFLTLYPKQTRMLLMSIEETDFYLPEKNI